MNPSLPRFFRLSLRITAVAALLSAASSAWAAMPFPHEGSDLKPDPALRFGSLPNGVRYVVMANSEPKGRAALRLGVEVGSFHEREDERGLAHFLEHMAFNGSKNFPGGSLIETLQRFGMSFGHDTNAMTTFDRTIYQLTLPNTELETLRDGIKVLGDYAGYLDIPADMVAKERPIIESERLSRDSISLRMAELMWRELYKPSIVADRFPIGLTEVINTAPRERLVDFYNAWYRPERMLVVAVGDFDADAVIREIEATFSVLTARAPARPEPNIGKVDMPAGIHAYYFSNPELSASSIGVRLLKPYVREPDSRALRVRDVARGFAFAIMNQRLQLRTLDDIPPYTGATVTAGGFYELARDYTLNVTVEAGEWREGMKAANQEIMTALKEGFRDDELAPLLKSAQAGLPLMIKNSATRDSNGMAEAILTTVMSKSVLITAADNAEMMKPVFDKLTVADCNAAFREAWQASYQQVVLTGPENLGDDAKAQLKALYEEFQSAPLTSEKKTVSTGWLYEDFGPAGRVVKREEVADLGITLLTFSNGVRVNLKRTDFVANQVAVQIRIGNGSLTEPESKPGLGSFSSSMFPGGLGRAGSIDLKKSLAGRSVQMGFGVGGDAFQFGGGTTKSDLLLALQVAAAMITDPGYRSEGLTQFRRGVGHSYDALKHSMSAPYFYEVSSLLVNNHPRYAPVPREKLLSYTPDDIKEWIGPALRHADMEVAIVGDIDVDEAITALATTLGALPVRSSPVATVPPQISFPSAPFSKHYAIPTEIPQGMINIYWPTTDGMDSSRGRRLSFLSSVLRDRLRVKIREQLGGTYSPGAGSTASGDQAGYGFISASATVEPDNAPRIADAIVAVADELSRQGVTKDEMDRVMNPMMTAMKEAERTNGYWMQIVAQAQSKPERLDWARTGFADTAAITAAEINALAKTYLGSARSSRVIIVSSSKPVAAVTAKDQSSKL